MSSELKDWKYYNHAMIPNVPPHITPDLSCIENGDIWKHPKKPLLARWISDFDCEEKTNWWYVIKDTPFDINSLKSKRRYEINKGNKFFDVVEIDPCSYKDELFIIHSKALASYSRSKLQSIDYNHFSHSISSWKFYKFYGAFHKESGNLCAYALLNKQHTFIDFTSLKSIPEFEKYGLNTALVYKILLDHSDYLNASGYICDGSRNINHETAFQDYLEKYFGFRKAYCKLHIKYNFALDYLIKLIYPFRNVLIKFDKIRFIHLVNSILKMEGIVRNNE